MPLLVELNWFYAFYVLKVIYFLAFFSQPYSIVYTLYASHHTIIKLCYFDHEVKMLINPRKNIFYLFAGQVIVWKLILKCLVQYHSTIMK
jgi:hypothetical protein